MNESNIARQEEANTNATSKEEQQPAKRPLNTDKNDTDAFWRMYPLTMSLTAGV